jgi:hypothetical protein
MGRILRQIVAMRIFYACCYALPPAGGRQRPFQSVRFVPVAPNTDVDLEGHRQCRRPCHVGT